MQVVLNGEQQELESDLSVAALVERVRGAADGSGVAVAINAEVVPLTEWPQRTIHEDDHIEILTATQGG